MEMEEDGRWGDHFTLQAAADLYETTIHLVDCESRNRDVTIMAREGSSKHSKLMLGHIHELHYVSLRPKLGKAFGNQYFQCRKYEINLSGKKEYKFNYLIGCKKAVDFCHFGTMGQILGILRKIVTTNESYTDRGW